MILERTASNRKAAGHMVAAVTSSPCSFDVSSSSPTTVSGRIVEDPGNLNSCKRAIKLIYHTTNNTELQFLSLKFSESYLNPFTTTTGFEMHFLVYNRQGSFSQIWKICIFRFLHKNRNSFIFVLIYRFLCSP